MCLAIAAALAAAPVQAQQPVRTVHGSVSDSTGTPVAQADVSVLHAYWSAETDADGTFLLRVPDGRWTLVVRRLGFASDTLQVTVCDTCANTVHALVSHRPIALKGVTVEARSDRPFSQTVTPETIRQMPALVEPDLFRAIVVLPGVSQPNDLNGRIHLAGGSSDETGIRLDGHPLQDPFHLLGIFGAFNVEALEKADVRIHHLSPDLGDALSGVVDMESLQPQHTRSGNLGASLLSSHAVLSWPQLPGHVDGLAAGRITYISTVVDQASTRATDILPNYYDGILRVGRDLGASTRLALLGYTTRDWARIHGKGGDRLQDLTIGESLLGARLTTLLGRYELRARASFDYYNHGIEDIGADPDVIVFGSSTDTTGDVIRLRRDWISAAAQLARMEERWRLEGGIGLDVRTINDRWRFVSTDPELLSSPGVSVFAHRERLTELSAFGSGSVQLARSVTATIGARSTMVEGKANVAPRIALSYRPGGTWGVDLAYDRRYQYTAQSEDPIVGSIAAPIFLLHRPRQVDVLGLAAHWSAHPGRSSILSLQAQAFGKVYHDQTRPDTSLFAPVTDEDARFTRVRARSGGISLSGRLALWGDWLFQGSYTFQRTFDYLPIGRIPGQFDVPHTLVLFTSLPLGGRWSMTALLQAHSGRLVTPFLSIPVGVSSDSLQFTPRLVHDFEHPVRLGGYQRVDVGVQRRWQSHGAEWALSFQVLNVTARSNPIDLDFEKLACVQQGVCLPGSGLTTSGLPILPSIGLEIRW
ncbi:MAG TPA: TonB-dependent receptor [Gemmatimonadaceae bacterium]|nr:TonB-dependent receptor [Gemmatimonadaceae bacterium]